MKKIRTVQTGAQRVLERYNGIKQLKQRINQYVCDLNEKDREKLYRCYNSNNINFNRLNRFNMPNDFRSPVAHHCFRLALDIQF